jgi:hypothetical protein
MEMSLVYPGQVSYVLPALLPYLQKSEAWTGGKAKVDDILRFILNGQMYLFVAHENNTIYGHVIVEVKQYPQCNMLVVQHCAGEDNHMVHVEDKMFEILDKFAKDAKCSGIEFVGRPGWRKTANKYGYELRSVTYQRMLGE